MRALAQWILGLKVTIIDTDYVECDNKGMARAFNQQIKLGISNMIRGLLANELREQQHIFYSSLQKKEHGDGSLWSLNVIALFINFSLSCWNFRCEAVHSITELTSEKRLRSECETLFIELKSNHSNLPPTYQHLLNRNKHFFSNAPIPNLQSWLRRVNVSLNTHRQSCQQKSTDIRTWLCRKVRDDCSNGTTSTTECEQNAYELEDPFQCPSITTLPFIPSQSILPETHDFF